MLLNSCHFWKERKRKEKKEGGRKGRAFHDSATQKRNVQPYKKITLLWTFSTYLIQTLRLI